MNVSAIIPTYNSCDFIAETMQSLLDQSKKLSEIIVIDDGSTDNTQSVISEIASGSDVTIRFYESKKNQGVSAARNQGLELAQNDWVLFMDHDDIAEPQLLEKESLCLQKLTKHPSSDWVLVHSAYSQITEHGEFLDGIHRSQQFEPDEILGYEFVRNNIITTSGVLVRRDPILKIGGFDATLRYSQDWDLWLRLAQIGGFGYVDEPLVRVRRHSANTSKCMNDFLEDEKQIFSRYSLQFIEDAIQQRHLPLEINRKDFVSVLYRLGFWEEGFTSIIETLKMKPDFTQGMFLEGLYYLHTARWSEAQRCFDKLLLLDASNGAALNNLGAVLAVQGNIDEALNFLGRALSLFPGYIDASHNMNQINQAQKLSPDDARFTLRELRPVLLSYNS